MVAIWVVIGLVLAATSVSSLGAAFSIYGLKDLFAGAAVAIIAMAAALEFAKFVLAAYLHQRWRGINKLLRTYLSIAVVVLSLITSMGIFGFLSNAYQSASNVLDEETVKLDALKEQQKHTAGEIDRINKAIDEIPVNRVSKKQAARAESAPMLDELNKKSEQIAAEIANANLQVLAVKQKVGPLIYVSRAFNVNIDDVVKYLIMVFVSVFDPLAICLVVATSEALNTRRLMKAHPELYEAQQKVAIQNQLVKVQAMQKALEQQAAMAAPLPEHPTGGVTTAEPPTPPAPAAEVANPDQQNFNFDHPLTSEPLPPAAERVIHMRFAEEKETKEG